MSRVWSILHKLHVRLRVILNTLLLTKQPTRQSIRPNPSNLLFHDCGNPIIQPKRTCYLSNSLLV